MRSNKPKLVRSRSRSSLVAPGERRNRDFWSQTGNRQLQPMPRKSSQVDVDTWECIKSIPGLETIPIEDLVEAEEIMVTFDEGLSEIELGCGSQGKIFKGEVHGMFFF